MSIAISPDGKVLLAAESIIAVWSIEDDTLIRELGQKSVWTARGWADTAVGYTPSGAAISASGNAVIVWDATMETQVRRIEAKLGADKGAITALVVLSDELAVTGHLDGMLRKWDLVRGVALRGTLKGHRRRIKTLAVDRQGRVFSGAVDLSVRRWDLERGTSEVVLENLAAYPLRIDPDHEVVAMGSTALPLATITFAGMQRTLPGHDEVPHWLSFSPDGKRLASASSSVRIHDVQSGANVRVLEEANPGPLIVHGDSLIVARGLQRFPLDARSADASEPIEIRARHAEDVRGACAIDEGFATCSGDTTIKLWRPDGTFVTSLRTHEHSVSRVRALSKNRIASAGFDRRVLLWDLARREVIRSYAGCKEWVVALAFSGDERRIATCERLGATRVWDLESGKLIARMKIDDEWPALALSPDGETLFAGRRDGPIEVWSVSARKKLNELANDSHVRDFAIEPATQRLVAITNVVRSWSLADLSPGRSFRDHEGSIVGLSTEHDFTTTADDQGKILYWDLEKGPIGGRRRDPQPRARTYAGKLDGSFVYGMSDGEVMIVSAL